MNSSEIVWIVLLLLFIWVTILTILVFRISSHYSRLTHGTEKKDLNSLLDELLSEHKKNTQSQKNIQNLISNLEDKTQSHIQKIGLVRFNSYGDTGGNQSFSLALTDAKLNGIVLLSLHARDGTRVYVKNISLGKSDYDLSKEELEALNRAKL